MIKISDSDFSLFSKQAFDELSLISDFLFSKLNKDEQLTLSMRGERTQYLRFNHARIRQSSLIEQITLELKFQIKNRKISFEVALSQNFEMDKAEVHLLLERARNESLVLPEDPFATPMDAFSSNSNSFNDFKGELPSAEVLTSSVSSLNKMNDFVGIYAGGCNFHGVTNSNGLKHWFSTENFYIDYSLFIKNKKGEEKSTKGIYSDSKWNLAQFASQIQQSEKEIQLLLQDSIPLKPDSYRAYLGPGAVSAICDHLSWNALSYGAFKKGQSGFSQLAHGERQLSPLFTLKENFHLGLCPQFNSLGEMAPTELPLIVEGQLKNFLISKSDAQEYAQISNAAEASSFGGVGMRSPEIAPGSLEEKEILKTLGTGIYISHLHYLGWSDLKLARVTGMTRYACFWVENGEIKGPINPMRFDVSLYDLLGDDLEGLTRQSYIDPSVSSYFRRDLGGKKNPGILTKAFKFTL